jgi:hypothetical protein
MEGGDSGSGRLRLSTSVATNEVAIMLDRLGYVHRQSTFPFGDPKVETIRNPRSVQPRTAAYPSLKSQFFTVDHRLSEAQLHLHLAAAVTGMLEGRLHVVEPIMSTGRRLMRSTARPNSS